MSISLRPREVAIDVSTDIMLISDFLKKFTFVTFYEPGESGLGGHDKNAKKPEHAPFWLNIAHDKDERVRIEW